jgi:uncharacterized repeat protein (TIGR01451 family)
LGYQATVSDTKATILSEVALAQYDPNTNNNSARTGLNTATDAELKISMNIVTSGPYYIDAIAQYSVSIVNNGPDPATNVVFESLGENLVITGISSPCVLLPCQIANIANGAEVVLTMTGEVQDVGPFTHFVRVYADQNDVDLSNNLDVITRTVQPAADVEVQVPAPPAEAYQVGNEVQFVITVRNNGAISTTNVVVEPFLTNLELLSVSSLNCFNLPCVIPFMGVGASSQEVISVTARITDPGQFILNALVSSDLYDPMVSNNQQAAEDSATPSSNDTLFDSGFEGEN